MTKKVSTPKFSGENYKQYKKLVKLWEKVTDVDEDDRGAALILNMSGSALDIALAIDTTKTKVADLITILDKVYVEENNLSLKFDEFDQMKRDKDQNMKEFIHVYEQKLTELKADQLQLPDLVVANKLLRAANLSPNHYMLARSTCTEMTLEAAKASLLRITESGSSAGGTNNLIKVKQEDTDDGIFYGENDYRNEYHGNEYDDNEVFYQNGNRFRRNPYNRNNNKLHCYGCGDTSHWIKDCPKKNKSNNTYGRNDAIRQCYGCGDNTHWIKDCPFIRDLQNLIRSRNRNMGQRGRNVHFSENDTLYTEEEVKENVNDNAEKPIFFQSNVGNEIEDIWLVGETVNKAVLDSGASKTVCGKEWFDCYVDSIDDQTRKDMKEFPSETMFRFGVGKLKAMKMVHLPVALCGEKILLEVHIVDTDIPLLLSLKTMKRMGLHINFQNDKVEINGKAFDLEITTTGHYTLPLIESFAFCSEECVINTVEQCTVGSSAKDVKKIALKLHRRFAHARSERIIKLLENAGKTDKALKFELKTLDNSCDFCLKHRRSAPRPVVSLPLANEFNELVSMDLKLIKGVWVLHCIDYLTRFSTAHPLRTKTAQEVIEKFLLIWISTFGSPKKVLSDNGGEFTGEKWDAFCEAFNITKLSTAAEAPFSNGICERHNLLIGEMTEKIIDDVGCSIDVALMWAVHAKNSLINIFGFSPYQLVLGRNPNILGNSTNKLPAMSEHTSCQIVADHLNSIRMSRQAYIQAENSDRYARALRGKVFAGTHQKFCVGDTVYYKGLHQKAWHGPGKVIAQEGTEVLIKTAAGRTIKVHPCKIILKEEAEKQLNSKPQSQTMKDNTDTGHESSDTDSDDDDEDNTCDETNVPSTNNEGDLNHDIDTNDTLSNGQDDKGTSNLTQSITTQSTVKIGTLKRGDIIHVLDKTKGDNEWSIMQIINRGGKATGIHANYWNVRNVVTDKKIGIDLDTMEWIKQDKIGEETSSFVDHVSNEVFIQHFDYSNTDIFADAKEDELNKWKEFKVFDEVKRKDFPEEDVLSCRWVTTTKSVGNEQVHKARLVIRGFEEDNVPVSDSPTAQKSLARMCLAICNWKQWEIKSLDVRAAFLQSNDIDRIVLMKPPKEFRKDGDIVWKIKKPIYGLNDGARKWFITMKKKLSNCGCTSLKLDPSVYVFHHGGKLSGFLVVHVDDILVGGDHNFQQNVLNSVCSDFKLSTMKSKQFKYIGWDINQKHDHIEVDQIAYQNGIEPIELTPARRNQSDHELNQFEKKLYQQLLGKLQWISSQSRPDIRFAVLECSLMASRPSVEDIVQLNKVVKKLKKQTLKIYFAIPPGDVKDLRIIAFSDAALSNLPDKTSSTRSYVIFLNSGKTFAPLAWCSKKLERVAKTIIYAEGIALGKCLDEAINLRETMLEILNITNTEDTECVLPIIGVTDSKSLWDNIKSSSLAADLKLRREVAAIKEQLVLKEVHGIAWTRTSFQLADCLTKNLASSESLLHVLRAGNYEIDLETHCITSMGLISNQNI